MSADRNNVPYMDTSGTNRNSSVTPRITVLMMRCLATRGLIFIAVELQVGGGGGVGGFDFGSFVDESVVLRGCGPVQLFHQPDNDRGFSVAACGEITNHDNRYGVPAAEQYVGRDVSRYR